MIWTQASMHLRCCSILLLQLPAHQQYTAVLIATCTCHQATHTACKVANLPATQCTLLSTPKSIPHRVGMKWSETAGTACDMSHLRTCSWSCREQT